MKVIRDFTVLCLPTVSCMYHHGEINAAEFDFWLLITLVARNLNLPPQLSGQICCIPHLSSKKLILSGLNIYSGPQI